MTTKCFDTSISVMHAKNWSVAEAAREVLQNWIDVRNQYGVGGSVVWHEDGWATVKDSGPGMQFKHLAFGMNDKAEGSIGQFGEGLKSALIVLVRNGRGVEIRTNKVVIRPRIMMSENFQTETLHFEIEDMPARLISRWVGTSIRFQCNKAELDAGRSYFSYFKIHDQTGFDWVEKNKISSPAGSVYVKGSAVGKINNALFSYHLSGQGADELANRDRNAVDMTVLAPWVNKIILNTRSAKVMTAVLKAIVEGTGEFETTLPFGSVWHSSKLWKRCWTKLYGKALLHSDNNSDNQAIYRGYQVLFVNGSGKFLLSYIGVETTAEKFAPRIRQHSSRPKIGKQGVRSLPKADQQNLTWVKKMVKKYYADPGKVVVVDNVAAAVDGADGSSFAGCYDPDHNRILVQTSGLSDRKNLLHTVLHETVHKVSGAEDLTEKFERALLDVAVGMIMDKAALKVGAA